MTSAGERAGTGEDGREGAVVPAGEAPPASPLDEVTLPPATGQAPRIPLVEGLRIIAARHEPGRGDYEPNVSVAGVNADGVPINYSASLPEGERISIARVVLVEDLRQARAYRAGFRDGDPKVFAGTTAFSLSTGVMRELSDAGRTDIVRFAPPANPLSGGLAGFSKATLHAESEPVLRELAAAVAGHPTGPSGSRGTPTTSAARTSTSICHAAAPLPSGRP